MTNLATDPNDLVSAVDATLAVLKSSTLVGSLVEDRIYGGSVPETEARNLVAPLLVVQQAGSGLERPGANDFVPMTVGRVDVMAYARSEYDAERVHLAAHHALKNHRSGVVDGILVRWVNRNSGPVTLRDTSVGWPSVIGTYIILFADVRI